MIYYDDQYSPRFPSRNRNQFRVNSKNPCPVCGKADWCIFSDNYYWVRCERSPYTDVSGWKYIKPSGSGALYMSENIPSNQGTQKHMAKADLLPLEQESGFSDDSNEQIEGRADSQTLHEVYTAFMAQLTLN